MFHPIGIRRDHKPLTRYMLKPGGHVIKVDDSSHGGGNIMIPTDEEIKTILYNQVRVSRMTVSTMRDNHIFF